VTSLWLGEQDIIVGFATKELLATQKYLSKEDM
jgi:hypothetical protein